MRMLFLALSFLLASQSHAHILTSHEKFESLHASSPKALSNEQNMKGSFNLARTAAEPSLKQGLHRASLNISLSHLGSNTDLVSTETSVLFGLGISALVYRRRKLQF
ncbi:hypothetical protein R6242_14800 [Iodobacter sp. CM08]|uniref:hypothetical protein n=1 Tax=Iodobacter sp. CM08 TaxID=3085902 RepID=UPI00298179A6|nr:hypothetical protein [Iodobacter sp. CM08]MDW5417833.1 hypothetical protein [Iodobacter sp. CM08]